MDSETLMNNNEDYGISLLSETPSNENKGTLFVNGISYSGGGSSDISSQLIVQKYSITSSSISANGTSQIEFDVRKSGYTTLGCVGWYVGGTGTTNCYTKQAYVNSSGSFSLYLKNVGNSSVTPTVDAHILYLKNN